MKRTIHRLGPRYFAFGVGLLVTLVTLAVAWCGLRGQDEDDNDQGENSQGDNHGASVIGNAARLIADGQATFRFDTFGDESFWGDTLRLHEAVATLTPRQALALGLKVDGQALSKSLQQKIKAGKVDLDDPAVTLQLLRANAVVGVIGFFGQTKDRLSSVGLTCAVCHSTVNDSLAPGIGDRLDGWANHDLNTGAIIAAAPNLKPITDLLKIVNPALDDEAVRGVLNTWGPGKFDAELLLDGKAFQTNGRSAATLI